MKIWWERWKHEQILGPIHQTRIGPMACRSKQGHIRKPQQNAQKTVVRDLFSRKTGGLNGEKIGII